MKNQDYPTSEPVKEHVGSEPYPPQSPVATGVYQGQTVANWAELTLTDVGRILELPSEATLGGLVDHAKKLMVELRTLRAKA